MPIDVLIADDNDAIREVLECFLTQPGFPFHVIAHASDGVETARLAMALSPGVVLLDIFMPAMDGISVMKMLKESGFSGVFITFSASGSEELALKAKKAGSAFHMTKPFDLYDMAQRILDLSIAGYSRKVSGGF